VIACQRSAMSSFALKSSLLATLDYLEQQRRLEQNAQRSANDDIAERWQAITAQFALPAASRCAG
ncbi:hypothetical protein L246_01510, partial [Salmonella enterica subsp. enterica serovar Worthington str. BCH-5715]